MRKANVLTIAVLLASAVCMWAGTLEIGETMPAKDTEMKNVDGKMLTLEEIASEKGTLVIFSCRHCLFVYGSQERMVEIGNEYKDKGIGVVFINSNDTEKYPQDNFANMQEQAEENNYEFPYLLDSTSEVAKAFGAARTPEAFLFDKDGKLVYHGAIDDSPRRPKHVKKKYLKNALNSLLAGEEVEVEKTKSKGCGIKFR